MGIARDKKKIVYCVEILAVLACLLSFLLPLSHFSYVGSEMESEYGIYMEGMPAVSEPGYYIDNSVAEPGTEGVVITPATDLRFGSYNVTFHYIASNSGNTYSCVSDWNTMPVTLGRTEAGLYQNENSGKPMVITLNSGLNIGEYQVEYNFCGDGYLYIYGLEIQETVWWKIYLLLVVICLIAVINVCMLLTSTDKTLLRGNVILVVILTIFASLPLFDPYLMTGHDMGFHLERIEALTDNFRNGQIPSRIASDWLDGKGYAASIFYGDLFLVIPAVLRLMGSTLQMAYKIYMFLINLATAAVSMFCFSKIFGIRKFGASNSRFAIIVATVMFVLSPYRLVCLYTRAAVGEYTAIVFYPLVFWGLMRLYDTDDSDRDNGSFAGAVNRILPLIIGITGIVNCHVLSGVIAAIFIIGFALANFRKTFTKRILGYCALTGILVLILNLWYIVPFLQVMSDGIGVLGLKLNGRFRSNGTYIWQMLSLFPRTGISLSSEEIRGEARTYEMVVTIGAGVITLITYAVLRGYGFISGKASDTYREASMNKELVRTADTLFVVSLIMLLLATPYFPWDAIKRISSVTNSLVTNIQFPFRFLSVAVLCISLITAIMVQVWPEQIRNYAAIFGTMIVMLCVVSASYYYTDRATADDYTYIADDFNDGGIMGAEYLPSGTAEDYETNYNEPYSENVTIGSWYRNKGRIYVNLSNNTSDIGEVTVPFIYYRGYRAQDAQNKGAVEVVKDNNGFAKLRIGSGYNGDICVYYREPMLWRICEAISLLGIIALVILIKRSKSGKKGETFNGIYVF